MLAGSTTEASFRISIDGNAAKSTAEVSSSARLAAQAIGKYEDEIKVLSGDLRRLKGNSEEVNAAKAALKKRIDAAKSSVSGLTTELVKQNTSYSAATAAAKKYGDGVGKLPNLRAGIGKGLSKTKDAAAPYAAKLAAPFATLGKKIGGALGPVGKAVKDKIAPAGGRLERFGSGAKKALGSVGKAVKQDIASVLPSASSALSALGTAGTLAAAGAAAAALAVVAAGAAVVGFGLKSADSAAKLNRQRQALLGNADDAKRLGDQIQDLAGKVPAGVEELNAMSVSLSKTRLSGKAIVSTMAAVAQATGAVDASAGAKIQELVTRGQQSGRFALQRLDLQGTGIDFDDVAKEYAAGSKKSVEAAKKELTLGMVPLEAGAEALKKATEKKFGDLNIANAFSLENAPTKFFEQLQSLASDIDLKPITTGLREAFAQLSPEAPLGRALKTFITDFVGGFAQIAGTAIPVVVEGVKLLMAKALNLGSIFYETKKAVKDAFDVGDWTTIGKEIIVGLGKGLLETNVVVDAVKSLATAVKKAFTSEMQIHSPSRVFAKFGENTTEGYAQGVDRGSRRASESVQSMVDMPSAPAGSGSSAQPMIVNITVGSGANAQDAPSPAFLAGITQAVREAARNAALGTAVAA